MGARETSLAPRLLVIVPTRGRPDMLAACVRSVLASDHESFELIVVDQSSESAALVVDDRLSRLHRQGKGKSVALNIGIAASRGEILAFTDDDCTVPTDWLSKVESLFDHHPELEMAFGNLTPIEYETSTGYVPGADHRRFRVVRGAGWAHIRGGAGADLAARRSLFEDIGGFDEQIGPGSRFTACEEYDLYYRALAAGAAVALDPDLDVTHWGYRPYADGSCRRLQRGYAYGEGAVIAKHLRLGDAHMLGVAAHITGEDLALLGRSLVTRRLSGIGFLAYRWRGIVAGLFARVDRRTGLFAAAPARRHGSHRLLHDHRG